MAEQIGTMDAASRTVPSRLHHWATRDPDTPAFIFVDAAGGRCVLTRADVFRFSSRYAAILRRQGVKQGTRVCNTLPNSPERLLTDKGVIMAGGEAMNLPMFLTDGEDSFLSLKKAEAYAVIVDPRQLRGALEVLKKRVDLEEQGDQVSTLSWSPALKRVFEVDLQKDSSAEKPLLQLLEREQDSFVADVKPHDTAFIFSTSGTTGFSKLVPHSHENALVFMDRFDIRPGEVFYSDFGLGWAGGFPSVYLPYGNTRVLPDQSQAAPDDIPGATWDAICREQCSVACLTPVQMLQLIDLWQRRDQQQREAKRWRLRTIWTGSQPLMKKHMEAIGTIASSVCVFYGMTEGGLVSCKRVEAKEDYEDNNNGMPLKHVKLRVVNKELQDQPVGERGQILVQSPYLFDGYVGNQEATQQVFTEDGWLKTGDVGYLNHKGEIFVVCRMANSIIRGPFLLYPGWLERRISSCRGVAEVIIVPVPDPELYQELCACIVPQPGVKVSSAEVKRFCEAFFLQPENTEVAAVPKYYLFFDNLPTTASGKVIRHATAALARERLRMKNKRQSL